MPDAVEAAEKPRFRGRLHQVAFILSIPAGATLIALGRTGTARAAAAIYSVTLTTLFGVSASYHRLHWSAAALRRMHVLDHSAIFLLIAGTYTPFSLLVLEGAWRWTMLGVVWGGALAGTILKTAGFSWDHIPTWILYLGLGWLAILALPQVARNMSDLQTALLITGGMLYTAGAIMFAMRRPVLKPRVFGFHELWHSMVLGGSLCHYALTLGIVATAR